MRRVAGGRPHPRVIIALDETGSPLGPARTKCDFLFFGDPDLVMSIEVKDHDSPDIDKATRQLQAGANAADQLAPRDVAVRFRPVLVSRDMRRDNQIRLRSKKVRFRKRPEIVSASDLRRPADRSARRRVTVTRRSGVESAHPGCGAFSQRVLISPRWPSIQCARRHRRPECSDSAGRRRCADLPPAPARASAQVPCGRGERRRGPSAARPPAPSRAARVPLSSSFDSTRRVPRARPCGSCECGGSSS